MKRPCCLTRLKRAPQPESDVADGSTSTWDGVGPLVVVHGGGLEPQDILAAPRDARPPSQPLTTQPLFLSRVVQPSNGEGHGVLVENGPQAFVPQVAGDARGEDAVAAPALVDVLLGTEGPVVGEGLHLVPETGAQGIDARRIPGRSGR